MSEPEECPQTRELATRDGLSAGLAAKVALKAGCLLAFVTLSRWPLASLRNVLGETAMVKQLTECIDKMEEKARCIKGLVDADPWPLKRAAT